MRAPNIVPKDTVRLSEAFDRLCLHLDPDWKYLPDLCGRWDELLAQGEDDPGEDPYRHRFIVEYRAERLLRRALTDGDLRSCIHNLKTGVDLELDRAEWNRMAENVGIHSDYTDDCTPGPDCQLEGTKHPIFISKEAFENWLGQGMRADAQGDASEAADLRDTRSFSLEEVIERTGLSKTKLYGEIEAKRLLAKKCGNRTLFLESELSRFLQNLPNL